MAEPTALLPVTTAGWTMAEIDGELATLPTVELDVAGRPDVADLARVHAIEGIGDLRTLARRIPEGIRFDVVLTRPVRCTLAFVVGPEHHAVLTSAAVGGSLVLATGNASAVGSTWLSVDLDRDALGRLLEDALS